ncbi:MAG: hypothetical protein LQ349_007288, partial [Xanthoria aureola]
MEPQNSPHNAAEFAAFLFWNEATFDDEYPQWKAPDRSTLGVSALDAAAEATPGLGGKDLDPTFFVPQSRLETYLRSHDRVENLLDAVLDPEGRHSVAARYIRDNYLRTFAILLYIGEGPWISTFQQYRSLRDDKLPYDTEPADFPKTHNSDLFTKFKAAQWQFCAMALQYDMKDRFSPEVILPIRSKTEIGSGGSAIIFKIVVDEAYNSLHPIVGQ